MIIEENQGAVVEPEATTEEGESGEESETISVSKKEWEKSQQTIGSLKRELKDAKKPKEDAAETTKKPEGVDLVQKTYLRAAGIAAEDEVELALTTAKKWDMPIDKLVDDEDFKAKLEKHRAAKANADATSNIRGNKSASSAKTSPEYYIARGTPPTAAEVPDRKERAKIARSMMANEKSGKTFYSD